MAFPSPCYDLEVNAREKLRVCSLPNTPISRQYIELVSPDLPSPMPPTPQKPRNTNDTAPRHAKYASNTGGVPQRTNGRKTKRNTQALLTPPLTPSSSLRTTASNESDGPLLIPSDFSTGIATQDPECTRLLLIEGLRKECDPARLAQAFRDAASSAKSIPASRQVISFILTDALPHSGAVLVAFFDVRDAKKLHSNILEQNPAELGEFIEGDGAWPACRFAVSSDVAQLFPQVGNLVVDGAFVLSARRDLRGERPDPRVNDETQLQDINTIQSTLKAHGDLRTLTLIRREMPRNQDEAHIYNVEFFDLRDGLAAFEDLRKSRMLGFLFEASSGQFGDHMPHKSLPSPPQEAPLRLIGPPREAPVNTADAHALAVHMADLSIQATPSPTHFYSSPPHRPSVPISVPAVDPSRTQFQAPACIWGPNCNYCPSSRGPGMHMAPRDAPCSFPQPLLHLRQPPPPPSPAFFSPMGLTAPPPPHIPYGAPHMVPFDGHQHNEQQQVMNIGWLYAEPSYGMGAPPPFQAAGFIPVHDIHPPPPPPFIPAPSYPMPLGPHNVIQEMPAPVSPPILAPTPERMILTPARSPNGSGSNERNLAINFQAIADGMDTRTTVMIKNIPNKMTDKDLKKFIDDVCPRRIDFLYLRVDFKNECNVGYAFVNFLTVEDLVNFANKRLGEKWNLFASEKVLQMSYATYQGKEALVEKFKNSHIMDERDGWRPKIFYSNGPNQGLPEPFPPPTHQRRKERSTANRGELYNAGLNGHRLHNTIGRYGNGMSSERRGPAHASHFLEQGPQSTAPLGV